MNSNDKISIEELDNYIDNAIPSIKFGKEDYLIAFNSPTCSYRCEKSGYVVFTFDEDVKSTTERSGVALFISDSNGEKFIKNTVLVDTTIFVPAGAMIYVHTCYRRSFTNPYWSKMATVKFIPIIDNTNDIIYEKIHNRNKENKNIDKLLNEVIEERPIDKETIRSKDKEIIEKANFDVMKDNIKRLKDLNKRMDRIIEIYHECIDKINNIIDNLS